MKKILIIEDDATIVRGLETAFKFHGFDLLSAEESEEGLSLFRGKKPDLVILDIMLPGLDGFSTCKKIREYSKEIPIIILSARGDEHDKVNCLELGADDYLTKPFGIAELMARINTAFRHRGDTKVAPARSSFTTDGLEINYAKRRVTVKGKEITLTPTEFSLLQQLAVNSDKVLTHSMLLHSVWGSEYSSEKEYLRVFVGRLRRKLEPDPKNPRYIHTIPGVGYHLATS